MPTPTEMFEALRPRLTAISLRIGGSEAEAADVVQDCYFKWQAADCAALATPAAWLTTVVQHRSIDRLRKRMREEWAAAAQVDDVIEVAGPEDALLQRAELAEALGRLARLSASERLALVLHDALECEHADIAALLGTSTANARQYLSRARRRLRAAADEPPLDEKLCRELVRQFQAALNRADLPAVINLLAAEQPVSVRACANDRVYRLAA